MLLWLGSGLLVDSAPIEEAAQKPSAKITRVKVRDIVARDYPVSISMRARTEPNRSVDVRAELTGRVVSLPLEKGALVAAGDLLCELAAEDRVERSEQAKAALVKAQLDYDGAQRLKTGGYQSRTAIADAKAKLETAKANAIQAQVNRDNLKIKAPFDGVLDARPVEIGDFMQRGDVCGRVLDLNPLLVTGQVAEDSVAAIRSGSQVIASLATGEQVQGSVRFVERNADQITRTFRMEALIPNDDLALRSGLTARLNVPVGVAKAHLVNSSLLALDDDGNIGIKIVDENKAARYLPVEIIGDQAEGVWILGLPDNATLITIGQQYVTDGETVQVVVETQDANEVVAGS